MEERSEGEAIAIEAEKKYTDQELLDMRPAMGAGHETWRAYHQLLYEARKLNPPK